MNYFFEYDESRHFPLQDQKENGQPTADQDFEPQATSVTETVAIEKADSKGSPPEFV